MIESSTSSELTVVALDGSLVRFSGPLNLASAGTTMFALINYGGGVQQEFGSGGLDFAKHVARAHRVTFSEEYAFEGGRLRLGSVVESLEKYQLRHTLRLGLWEGKTASVKTVMYNRTPGDLLAVYEQLGIEETPLGAILRPKNGYDFVRDGRGRPNVWTPVPGFGLIDVSKLTTSVARGLPSWPGARVKGGELFVQNRGDAQRELLILVGDTAVAQIDPDGPITDSLVEAASELTLDWKDEGLS